MGLQTGHVIVKNPTFKQFWNAIEDVERIKEQLDLTPE